MTKNSGIFYQELRERSIQVQEYIRNDDTIISKLSYAAFALFWLADQVRKEGLLWLGDGVNEDEKASKMILSNELKNMANAVMEGTEPEIVEDVFMKKYFAGNYTGVEGFLYLVYLDSMLNIQAGENIRVFRMGIEALMPYKVVEELNGMVEEYEKKTSVSIEDKWSDLYNKTIQPEDDPSYYIIRLLDYCITNLDDVSLQRLLRDVENTDLGVAMKRLGGAAYRKIHDNTSKRLRAMLMEDMEYMGPVRLVDVAEADSKIFRIILKLGAENELTVPGNLDKIFIL